MSGLNDYDYQPLSTLSMGMKHLNQLVTTNKISIPPEIMDHFKRKPCPFLPQFNLSKRLPHFRYEVQLHDGLIPRDRTSLANH